MLVFSQYFVPFSEQMTQVASTRVHQAGIWDWYAAGARVDTFAALHDVPVYRFSEPVTAVAKPSKM